MQQIVAQSKPRGRRPATELAEKRAREIATLEAAVAKQKNRLEDLKNEQRRAQKSARRTQLNQRKFAFGGLAQIAGLLEADPGFVLGALLVIADQRERDGTWPSAAFLQYKTRGDEELAARAAARKSRRHAGDNLDEDEDD